MRTFIASLGFVACCAAAVPDIALEPAYPAFKIERPVDMDFTSAETGLVYVLEQHKGRVWCFKADGDGSDAKVVLDIGGISSTKGNENGLLALELAPDFDTSGVFYTYYTDEKRKGPHQRNSVLSRWKFDKPDEPIEASSEEVLLKFKQPYGNHNGGDVKFGHDGMLYLGIGDGGSQRDPEYRAQDLSNFFGSVLRIDVSKKGEGKPYAIPADNPFVNQSGALPEIWCYGLRNPWRLTVDRKTGKIWCGDVGQGKWEEVSVLEAGGNYGWLKYEGTYLTDKLDGRQPKDPKDHIPPVFEYRHGDMKNGGNSISGGFVYRGTDYPALQGVYLCGDYASGCIFGVHADDPSKTRTMTPRSKGVSAFGEDPQGELYVVNLASGTISKVIAPSK